MKNPELEAELSQIIERLPYSKDIWTDSWRIREILAELGALSEVKNIQEWPKPLTLEELNGMIGQEVYIVCAKNRAYDVLDTLAGVNLAQKALYLTYSSTKLGYGTTWLAYNKASIKELAQVDPTRFAAIHLQWS